MTSPDQISFPASADIVREYLDSMHQRSQDEPIEGADADGVFREPHGLNLQGFAIAKVPAVVPDTNVLRDDVLRICRTGQRTVLVNTANVGAVRLLCPIHIVDEMFNNAERFAADGNVEMDAFLKTFRQNHLPLLRVVGPLPAMLFTSDENDRLSELNEEDPDDVPAAKLAMALSGYFASKDIAALRAVYGPRVDLEAHKEWVDTLKAGGDAYELFRMLERGAIMCRAVGAGAAAGMRGASRSRVGAILAAAMAGLVGYLMAAPERRTSIKTKADSTMHVILEVVEQCRNAADRIASYAAPEPLIDQIRALPEEAVLTRTLIRSLSAHGGSTCSAAELHSQIPRLDVAQGEAKVRAALRSHACFVQPYRGRFQLGSPAPVGIDSR